MPVQSADAVASNGRLGQVLTDVDNTNNAQLTALCSDKYEEFTTTLVRNTKYFEFPLA